MGFGTVVATGLSIILLLITSYALFMGFSGAMDAMIYSMKDAQNLKNDQLKTEMAVVNINANGHNITFDVMNTGKTKITNISKMDLIFKFNRTQNKSYSVTYWVPYTPDAPGSVNTWSMTGIEPDMINPRLLDPGETMHCKAYLEDELYPLATGWISVTSPNGSSGSAYFTVSP